MSTVPRADFLEFLYKLCPDYDARSDGELLERFIKDREETAFRVLVKRHGRMVQGVCRRVLGDYHLAEDSFQATFIILARRAASIRNRQSLGTWLYAVAQQVARRAKVQREAQRCRERQVTPMPSADQLDEATWDEIRPILDEAIGKLAEKYRSPIVLYYFEGKTRQRIAQELGWAEGTVARRLARGRDLLRQMLTRRGITLSAGALAVALSDKALGTPLAVALTIKTAQAAASVASGKALAGAVLSAQALALAEDVMGMLAIKGKLIIMVLALCLAVGGAGYCGLAAMDSRTDVHAGQREEPRAKSSRPDPKPKVIQARVKHEAADEEKGEIIAGIVVDEAGQPVAGAEVTCKAHQAPPPIVSKKDGTFQFRMRALPNYGLFLARSRDGERLACLSIGTPLPTLSPLPKSNWQSLRVVLKPAKRIEVSVAGGQGQPIAGARAGAMIRMRIVAQVLTDDRGKALLRVPSDHPVDQVYAWKNGSGFDYRSLERPRQTSDARVKRPDVPNSPIKLRLEGARTLRVTVVDRDGMGISKVRLSPSYLEKPGQTMGIFLDGAPDESGGITDEFAVITDEAGVASWNWLPAWQKTRLWFWSHTKDYQRRRLTWYPRDRDAAKLVLDRLEWLRGKVMHSNGAPAAGITIRIAGAGYEPGFNGMSTFIGTTRTAADGTYALHVAENQIYLVTVSDKKWAAEPHTGFAVFPKTPTPDKNFVLRSATTITGRLTLGKDRRPYAGQLMSLYQRGRNLLSLPNIKLPNPENNTLIPQPSLDFNVETDADGRFEFHVGPGQYYLSGPSQIKREKIIVTDQAKLEFNFNAPRVEMALLKGLVVTGSRPVPVGNAKIEGVYRATRAGPDITCKTDAQGRFETERSQHRVVLHAQSADGRLHGIVEIGPEEGTVTLPLVKAATARGRLLDGGTGKPMPNREIVYGVRVYSDGKNSIFRKAFEGEVQTDSAGRFELVGIVARQKYDVSVTLEGGHSWRTVHTLVAAPGETVQMGDVKLAPDYRPPTLAESLQAAFNVKGTPLERFNNACRDARLSRQHVLVVFAPPKSTLPERLLEMTRERDELRGTMDDFRTVWVAADVTRLPAARLLADRLGRDLNLTSPVLVVTDERGLTVAARGAIDLQIDGKLDPALAAKFLKDAAPKHLDANKLLEDALAQARKENKRIIVQETATWCPPCWKLSRFLDRHRDIWEKDYLWIKLDRRWTGAANIAQRLRNKAEGGIPWTAILDADGKVLATSNDKEGTNIGFPNDTAGIAHFSAMLRATAQRLTEADITRLEKALRRAY